jgi:uncharacterized RDD family membrane protein YckC
VVASIGDSVITELAVAALIAVLFSENRFADYLAEGMSRGDVAVLLLGGAYSTVMVAAWRTTITKRLLGLYVVRTDGSRIGLGRAFARYLAYFASILPLFAGFLLVALRRDKRALHDLICDTRVVRARRGEATR